MPSTVRNANFLIETNNWKFNQKFNPYEDGNSGKRVIDMCLRALPHKRTLYERFVRYTKKTLNRMRILWLLLRYNVLGFFRSHGMFHNNNSLRLERLKDSHKGERCFLIGNGPSLTGEDLHLLKDEYTFGTNMVYKIFDKTDWRPSFHCVSDTIYATSLASNFSKDKGSSVYNRGAPIAACAKNRSIPLTSIPFQPNATKSAETFRHTA